MALLSELKKIETIYQAYPSLRSVGFALYYDIIKKDQVGIAESKPNGVRNIFIN